MSGKRYRTIVADPPWEYAEGYVSMVGPARGKTKRVSKHLPYAQMSVDEIKRIPVGEMAEESAALFLWTTNRYLPESFGVIKAWGFTYTQTLVWVKSQASPFVASIAPNHSEYVLVARRGNHRWGEPMRTNVLHIPVAPQWQEHSRKPEAFMDHFESASQGPYLELFSRRARLGWDTWGNESLHGGEA